ncbi:hypothetical protein [Bradyrhizobium sp. CCBAU 11361]|uniref:hypothetical protein n=1 Tax=Bradyrhizobium sp. CCBAU 11361 TaxID=1630812 RepID=UPI002305EBEA|nr:hypothetical protein [Bradyrhizobium sp. CCBAU 11361]
MGYAFFTDLLASTRFPVHSVDVSSPARAKCIPEALPLATLDSARFIGQLQASSSDAPPAPLFQEGGILMRLDLLHLPLTDLFLRRVSPPRLNYQHW